MASSYAVFVVLWMIGAGVGAALAFHFIDRGGQRW